MMTASGTARQECIVTLTPDEQIETLTRIIENMSTEHVVFEGGTLHPDWCPLCRLERAEQIGSPIAIAQWIEQVVIPELGAHMNIPEAAVERGMVLQGCSAGDLLEAIRRSQVLL